MDALNSAGADENVLPEISSATEAGDYYYPSTYEEASVGNRFVNFIIDLVLFYAIEYVIGYMLGFVLSILGGTTLALSIAHNKLEMLLFNCVVFFCYYTVLEGTAGRTLGKLITKTKVVMEDGSKPDLKSVAIRSVSRLIPFEAFSFLGSNIGWHDSLSNTRVVKV